MNGRYLLDTNIVIALLNGDAGVLTNLEDASEVFVPAIVVGELFFGAAKSSRATENIGRVQEFVRGRTVLSCDLQVAREYGMVKWRLKLKGRPIPEKRHLDCSHCSSSPSDVGNA